MGYKHEMTIQVMMTGVGVEVLSTIAKYLSTAFSLLLLVTYMTDKLLGINKYVGLSAESNCCQLKVS